MKLRFDLGRVFLVACALALWATTTTNAEDAKTDVTGTWKWTVPARNDQPARDMSLKLKQDGEKLTGAVTGFGAEVEIQDGKVKDGDVSFKVVRKPKDREITSTYVGKLDGDVIKFKAETSINGATRSRDFEAKRAKE